MIPPSNFGVLENVNHTANYAVHATVIEHHNIAVTVNIKSVHHQLQHRHSIIIKTILQLLSILSEVRMSFAALPSVGRYLRFLTATLIDLEYFPYCNQKCSILVNLKASFRSQWNPDSCFQIVLHAILRNAFFLWKFLIMLKSIGSVTLTLIA